MVISWSFCSCIISGIYLPISGWDNEQQKQVSTNAVSLRSRYAWKLSFDSLLCSSVVFFPFFLLLSIHKDNHRNIFCLHIVSFHRSPARISCGSLFCAEKAGKNQYTTNCYIFQLHPMLVRIFSLWLLVVRLCSYLQVVDSRNYFRLLQEKREREKSLNNFLLAFHSTA